MDPKMAFFPTPAKARVFYSCKGFDAPGSSVAYWPVSEPRRVTAVGKLNVRGGAFWLMLRTGRGKAGQAAGIIGQQ